MSSKRKPSLTKKDPLNIQKLINDWSLVIAILDRDPSTELLLLFANLFEAHKKLGEFARHIVNEDTKRAESFDWLKEHGRAANLCFIFLSSDLGRKFLSHSYIPMINEINSNPIFEDGKGINFPSNEEDVKWILEVLSKFNEARRVSYEYSPIIMREFTSYIRQSLHERWPEEDADLLNAKMAAHCTQKPCIINPVEHGIMNKDEFKPQKYSFKGLQFAADLFMKISSGELFNETEPFASLLNPIIKKEHQETVTALRLMADPQTIDKFKKIIEASVEVHIDETQIELAENALKTYLNREDKQQVIQDEVVRQQAIEKIKQAEISTEWILRSSKKGISVFTKAEKDSEIHMTIGTIKVKTSMQKAYNLLHNLEMNGDSLGAASNLELLEKFDDNRSDYYFVTKFPFPFSPRDWVMTRFDTFGEKRSECLGYSTVREDAPPNKSYVRGHIFVNCTVLTTIDSESEYLNLTLYAHTDYRMQVPVWLENTTWKAWHKMLSKFKKQIESHST